MLKSIILLAVFVAALTHEPELDTAFPLVTTKQGTIRGITQRTLFGRQYHSFKCVRYAEPPVGELRFKPPVPVKSWEGVYDATKDGPACPQPGLRPVSEDCLCMYIHTPKLPKNGKNPKYPVLIHVHPGSYTMLTGNSAYAGADYLLDKDVVLVTFNYRLATLGFLSTGDALAPGNNGLKDQVQVMRWVQENIAAFGGNPHSVTLVGYSVGGLSVSVHLVSPMSRGLFHKVMIMSGSALANIITKTEQLDLAKKQARFVGCLDDTSANIVNCLKTIPAEVLGDTLEEFRVFGNDPQFMWQPLIEHDFGQERFLIEDPLISVQCGRFAQVPVLAGVTKDELVSLSYPVVINDTWLEVLNRDWNYIAPYAFYYDPNSNNSLHISTELKKFYFNGQPINRNSLDPLGELYSDALAGFHVNRCTKLLSRYNHKNVYYYQFTYRGRYGNFELPEGNKKYVVHFDDMLYVFWNSLQFPRFNVSDPEAVVVRKMTTLWANFAYTGNPVPRPSAELDGVSWTLFTEHNKKYLDIGNRLVMKRDVYPDRYGKWDSLFPLPIPNCVV